MNARKIVLITGASSGFGAATAAQLARAGHTVYGTSRKADQHQREDIHMLSLDVCDDESVAGCVERVLNDAGRIDVLINNAGYLMIGAIEETSLEQAKAIFETNFFGVARMVNAVLPTMRSQRSGKIITIASLAGLIAPPLMGFYAATKSAVIGYSEALRHEVKSLGIDVAVVEPGWFKTDLGDKAVKADRTIGDYEAVSQSCRKVIARDVEHGDDPQHLARLVEKIVHARRPRLHYRAGVGARWFPRLKALLPEAVMEFGVRKKFRLDK